MNIKNVKMGERKTETKGTCYMIPSTEVLKLLHEFFTKLEWLPED